MAQGLRPQRVLATGNVAGTKLNLGACAAEIELLRKR